MLGLFAVMAVADAAVCQINTDQNGNCLLPCICCHVAGVIHASPIIHIEQVTAHVQAPVTTAPALLASTIFHPPRA
ncbi:MAG: hypothetical protein QME75_13305 [Deltaproteobacteria bacterium]|nr:hypothetical protein [Deltaproteobacteria bacterium]